MAAPVLPRHGSGARMGILSGGRSRRSIHSQDRPHERRPPAPQPLVRPRSACADPLLHHRNPVSPRCGDRTDAPPRRPAGCGGGIRRRGLDVRGRLARDDELRRDPLSAADLHHREQPLRHLGCGHRAGWRADRGSGQGLRRHRRRGGRERPARCLRGGARGSGEGPVGRGCNACRGANLSLLRPHLGR